MFQQHTGALNVVQIASDFQRGVAMPPGLQEMLRRWLKRKARLARYRDRNASYPFSSNRQNARYTRQVASGQKTAANGVVFT